MNRFSRIALLVLICVVAIAGTGCQTYVRQNKGYGYWERGDVTGAVQAYTSKAEKEKNSRDAVIWRLEEGAALRGAGKYKESNDAFDKAEQRIDEYEQSAKIKAGRETIAMTVANQAILPYEGRAYDKIMMNTYKALNCLQLGEIDKARIELMRAYRRQQDAVFENARRIEKAKQEAAAESSEHREMVSRAENDPGFKSQIGDACKALNGLRPYGNYVNPFSVYLDGLFFMATATDAADLEHARKSFQRTLEFIGENKFVKLDLENVEGLLSGRPLSPTTYVIFETGNAPIREHLRLDIPLFIVGASDVPYVGAAFPMLKLQGGNVSGLSVSGGGRTENTALVCSMDSVVGTDFKNELPSIITKTLFSTLIKAASSYAVSRAVEKQDPLVQLAVKLAVAGMQISVNIADTRTWTTLPKEFQICRIPTPADRRIEISSYGSGRSVVTVGDGVINLIYVKSISVSSPLQISQLKLK